FWGGLGVRFCCGDGVLARAGAFCLRGRPGARVFGLDSPAAWSAAVVQPDFSAAAQAAAASRWARVRAAAASRSLLRAFASSRHAATRPSRSLRAAASICSVETLMAGGPLLSLITLVTTGVEEF